MDPIELPINCPKYKEIANLKFAPGFKDETIKQSLEYKARDDDIFIVTYPKSGTTWTQIITISMFNNGKLPDDVKSTETSHYKYSPFLESHGTNFNRDNVYVLKTHLTMSALDYNQNAKYIYVARNPKDVCVSFYYHTKMYKEYKFDGDFNDYFLCFLNGEVECGDYREHLMSWYNIRDKPNVLFLLYEDMKLNIKEQILKIAKFLNNGIYERLLVETDLLQSIMENCDFKYMKKIINKIQGDLNKKRNILTDEDKEYNFIRKGIIGDWRNHFTDEQNHLLNKWFNDKFSNTDIEHLWDNYMSFRE